MREIHSPPPQAEDHTRAHEPGLEEDPNIFVEFDGRVFYQASCDGTLVGIITDYPGLLLAPHVSKQETYLLKRIPSFHLTRHTYIML